MQTAVLPMTVCDVIDKKIRRFVWGGEEGQAKVHLVKWETICRSKDDGGLGLRSARALNLAYLMKLGWTFLNNENDLWVKVVQGKYVCQDARGTTTFLSKATSRLWQGIRKALPLMKQETVWDVRNGRSINFWHDQWLADGVTLKDYIAVADQDIDWNASMADMATATGMEAPRLELGEDVTLWGREKDGRFQLSSAYTAAAEWLEDIQDEETVNGKRSHWKHVWKWQGPNRIKHFLWLAAHDRLLTNSERKRRKLCTNDICDMCKQAAETTEHIIRDCPEAKEVWQKLGIGETTLTCGLGFAEWMSKHLQEEKTGAIFGVAAWYLWKRRNEWIFEKQFQKASMLAYRIQSWTSTIKLAQENDAKLHAPPQKKSRADLAWEPPADGWVVVNTDGSVRQPDSLAAAGGLIRDNSGRCLAAFVGNLGVSTVTRAEIKGAIQGLQTAWSRGYRKVHLQVDSMTTYLFFTAKDHNNDRFYNLATQKSK
ncbi:unnamed protein product [Linum tenue]|uniref:RNase H type-1 domain-containing protein n=1 Tax=Linum tenue TaxID=586396 RepID=A0AAV0MBW4_9ROSI|nr:unnamed protein product [Linum tenue]